MTRIALALCALTLALAACPPTQPRPARLCLAPLAGEGDEAPASQPASRPAPERPVTLIKGATVWTAAGAILERADVLLESGKVVAVGSDLSATEAGKRAARVVDGRGKHVTPGLIDPHSHIGVYPAPSLKGHGDGNEVAKPISPEVRVRDAFWPQDPAIPRALAAGVTTAHIVTGSTNLIGGQSLTVKMIPGLSAAELAFPGAPPGLKMACGENPKRTYGKKGGPYTRMGNVARVRAAFQRAREHRRARARHRDKLAAWKKEHQPICRPPATKATAGEDKAGERPETPKRDLGLEALVEVLEGKRHVHWHCYRADDMLTALAVANEAGFAVRAFHHATEAYKIRNELARSKTAAVIWVNWWGFKIEAYDTVAENAGLLLQSGAVAGLHSDSPIVIQRLNHEAALAYHHAREAGLPMTRDQALQLVTRQPARILGIEDRTGSLEPGKVADVVIWDGDPLSIYARPDKVFVDGVLRFDRARGSRPTDFELSLVPRPQPLSHAPRDAPFNPSLPTTWRPAAGRPLAPEPTRSRPQPAIAIVDAEIHAMDGRPAFRGTVVVKQGRILAVGPQVAAPADAQKIQAAGRPLTPGLIAAEATTGLVEISGEPSTADQQPKMATAGPVRAALRAWDAINPASPTVAVNRIEGITTVVVRPFGGLINGQSGAWDLDGLSAREIDLTAPTAMHAAFGRGGARSASGSRAMALMWLRRLLDDARLLRRARSAVEARRYRRLSAPVPQLVALIPVVEGKLPLVVSVRRAADILALLRLASAQRIKLALSGADEAWRVAPAIARAKVPVLVRLDNNLPYSFEALAARYDNAARLHAAGVAVAFSVEGGAHNIRSLRHQAGRAVAHGLPHAAAIGAMTVVPARIFGLRQRGTIARGKKANLVLWSGDPLELSTRADTVVIDGRIVPRRSRQTLLRDRYLRR